MNISGRTTRHRNCLLLRSFGGHGNLFFRKGSHRSQPVPSPFPARSQPVPSPFPARSLTTPYSPNTHWRRYGNETRLL